MIFVPFLGDGSQNGGYSLNEAKDRGRIGVHSGAAAGRRKALPMGPQTSMTQSGGLRKTKRLTSLASLGLGFLPPLGAAGPNESPSSLSGRVCNAMPRTS